MRVYEVHKIFETNIVEDFTRQYSAAVFDTLLRDRTTGKNIIWATTEYAELGEGYQAKSEILRERITGLYSGVIKPRVTKATEAQADRTKKKAEVMTPAWIVNKMNNAADRDWLRRDSAFNRETERSWETNEEPLRFLKKHPWRLYVDDRRLEITCGEAPFLVSRYDTTSGEIIPVKERIGLLDRKLRAVRENTETEADWLNWAFRALEATYGYEWQGDNLVIARINILQSFAEHMEDHLKRRPTEQEAQRAAKIISWNLWQMDGLKGSVPLGAPEEEYHQISLFSLLGEEDEESAPLCRINDWRSQRTQLYISLRNEGQK